MSCPLRPVIFFRKKTSPLGGKTSEEKSGHIRENKKTPPPPKKKRNIENGFLKYFGCFFSRATMAETRDKTFEMQDDGKAKLGETLFFKFEITAELYQSPSFEEQIWRSCQFGD